MSFNDSAAISRLCEYLRIKTVQPTPDYLNCRKFLEKEGTNLGLQVRVFELVKDKPIVIMSLAGTDQSLPALLLNSHTDVVPVTLEKWTFDPFEAQIVDGKIFARGSQDMKSVGMAYLEAIGRLISIGHSFRRTVHLSFMPDEEIGGNDGMKAFVDTDEFKALNVGFALDEGVPSPSKSYILFNDERAPWWVKVTAIGGAGHGSRFIQGSAVERLLGCLGKVQEFIKAQVSKLEKLDDTFLNGELLTCVNITMLSAGKQINVVPDEASAYLDIRVTRDYGEDGVMKLLNEWTSGEGLSYTFERRNPLIPETSIDNRGGGDGDPWWWSKLKSALEEAAPYTVTVFPGATDSRYLRGVGIPAIGMSPLLNTPTLLHDHDEHISCSEYLQSILVYEKVIRNLSSD